MGQDQLIEIEVPDLKKVQKQLGRFREQAPAVMRGAINDTIRHVSATMGKEARARYTAKASEIKKTLRIRRATTGNLYGEAISSSSKRVKLKGYKHTSGGSVFAQVKKGEGGVLKGGAGHAAAFVATMSSGHTGIFQRWTNFANRTPKGKRLQETSRRFKRRFSKYRGFTDNPIVEMSGLAVPQMFSGQEMSTDIIDDGQKYFQQRLDRRIERILEAAK